jgi:hypothetical protein
MPLLPANSTALPIWQQPWSPRIVSENRSGLLRPSYFLYIPLFLLSAGFLAWIFPTDLMLAFAAACGTAAGGYVLWDIVARKGAIRFSHFFFIADSFGYGLGTLNSWISIPRGGIDLAAFFHKDTATVTKTMAAVLISSAILCALGEVVEKPVFGSGFRINIDGRAIVLILFGTGILGIGYATGVLGYMGAVAKGGGGESVFATFLAWIFPTLFALTCLVFLDWPKNWMKLFLGLLLLIQFVLIVPTGRRNLIYCILLAAIAARFSSFRPKWSFLKKLSYTALLTIVIAVGATVFFYLRVAAYGTKRTLSMPERISLAIELYESGKTGKVNSQLTSNLQERTFVLGYLSDLLGASEERQPAMGKDIYHEFQMIIPGAFWEDKTSLLYQEEDIANMQYNFSYIDEANSTLTAGALDFGIWGMILYPLALCIPFIICSYFVRSFLPETVGLFITFALLFNALMTEAGVWTHLVALRNSIVFAMFLWCLYKIPNFGLRHKYVRQYVNKGAA